MNAVSVLLGFIGVIGVIGDMVRIYSSFCEESIEVRNRCGPLGPLTAFDPKSKSNDWSAGSLGVGISSNDERVVSLLRPALGTDQQIATTRQPGPSIPNSC